MSKHKKKLMKKVLSHVIYVDKILQIFKKASLNHIEVTYKDEITEKRNGTLYTPIKLLVVKGG